MSDPIGQLCQLVAERVHAHPTAEPSALAAQVREAIATNPQLQDALRSDRRMVQLNQDNAQAFQTLVEGGIANIGTNYIVSEPEKFREVLEGILRQLQASPQMVGIPNNLPRSGVVKFVGRETQLQELHQMLQQERSVAVTAIRGMGGVGKTELALQYALAYRAAYAGGLCWLSVRGADVGTQLVGFARTQLGMVMPDGFTLDEQVAYCWRRWPEGEVLLVYDDVTDYQVIRKSYLPPAADSRFRVLMTSRLQFGAGIRQLSLDVLSEAAALELLSVLAGAARVEAEPEVAKALCDWLGYLPLGVELVGRYLRWEENLTLAEMQQRLEAKRLEARALVTYEADMTAQQGVAAAFELSWMELSEEAQEVACLLSLFAAAPIPWPLVISSLSSKQSSPNPWLMVNRLVQKVKKAISKKGFMDDDSDDPEIHRDSLLNLHLLQRVAPETYGLHPLIREFLQVKRDGMAHLDTLKRQFIQVMVGIAQEFSNTPTQSDIRAMEPNAPHLAEVATELGNDLADDELLWPYIGLGRFYAGQGAYGRAEPWYKNCLEQARNRFGDEHPAVARSLNNLALLYDNQGRYSEAEPLFQQALAMRQRLLGDEHPDVAMSLNNLAGLYDNQGRYSEAEPLYQQALAICEKFLGAEHPNTQVVRGNLQDCLNRQGKASA